MKRVLIIVGVLVVCGSFAAPAAAAGPGWSIRVFGAGLDPSLNETIVNDDGVDIDVTSGSDLGFGASLEYQFTDLFGLELGGIWGSPDVELSAEIPGFGGFSVKDALSTEVLTLDLNFHLTPSSPTFDLYIGGGFAYLGYGDLHYEIEDIDVLTLNIGNDTSWSAKANLGIALGKSSNWSAFGGLRYIWSNIEGTEASDPTQTSETFDFDIFSFSVGIGYSF